MNFSFLKDVRVIESSAFIAAPLAGMTLAQFGADVIRIDMIGGGIDYQRLPVMPGGRSLYWTGLNKSKRSIAVDIRKPEGRELVRSLVTAPGEAGGALLTNIAASWLSHASLQSLRPDLVSCTILGNPDGSTAVDYTINASTGYPAMTGNGTIHRPVNHVLPAWDLSCAYQAAFAVLAAVTNRWRTGEGAEIRLALADVAFATLSHLGLLAEAELLGQEREGLGNYIYGAFGRDFGSSDGHRVMIAGISAGQWSAIVTACELDASWRSWDEAERFEARERIALAVEAWCSRRPLTEIERVFTQQKVCWGRYRTTLDLVRSDPRLSLANEIFEEVDTGGVGRHRAAGTPARLVGKPRGSTVPAPLLGEHTEQVLSDVLGMGSAEIGRLMDARIVAGP